MSFLSNFNKGRHVWLRPERDYIVTPASDYPHNHAGKTCLVIGTHPDVRDEVARALEIYPDADLCAVNHAIGLFAADHFATCHGEILAEMIEMHIANHGEDAKMPAIHVMKQNDGIKHPDDVYQWQGLLGAGSAPFAAYVMHLIGYDLIIFCGCPISGEGGYAMPEKNTAPKLVFHSEQVHPTGMIHAWQYGLEQMKIKHPDICAKFRSMSGFTKGIYGGIE